MATRRATCGLRYRACQPASGQGTRAHDTISEGDGPAPVWATPQLRVALHAGAPVAASTGTSTTSLEFDRVRDRSCPLMGGGEVRPGAVQEPDPGAGFLVGQGLRCRPGGSRRRSRSGGRRSPPERRRFCGASRLWRSRCRGRGPPATAVGDTTGFLDVDVDDVSRAVGDDPAWRAIVRAGGVEESAVVQPQVV